jgi:pimeloyl-ACP methyl ester carboxylesterase
MKAIKLNNETYVGANGRQSFVDFEVPHDFNAKIILFVHGFMGFKDWGCWSLVQEYFVKNGFGFCKFNFSHNGGTIENPIDFPDEEAVANNTYSKELFDVQEVIKWISLKISNPYDLLLIGHSRGGGIAALVDHEKVRKKIFLAPVASFESRFPVGKELEDWKVNGSRTIVNSRTKQHLKQHIKIWEDYYRNMNALNIETACSKNNIPTLVLHGNKDEAVAIEEGRKLANWLHGDFIEIKEANHTFGASHPWNSNEMPEHLIEVCQSILNFLA